MCNCFQTNLNKYRRWQKEARPQRLKIAFLEKSRFFFLSNKKICPMSLFIVGHNECWDVVLNCQKCNLWLKGHKFLQGCSPNQHGGSESLELGLPSRYLSLTSWWLLWLLWFKYLIKKDNLLSWALLDINQYQCKPNQILDRPLVCALFCCSWGLIVLECTFSSASFSHICSQSMPLMKVARERWWYQH